MVGPQRRDREVRRPHTAAPEDDQRSPISTMRGRARRRLDGSHYRDDILRLMFICAIRAAGDPADRAGASWSSSPPDGEAIARASWVRMAAMESASRVPRRSRGRGVPSSAGASERFRAARRVAAMIYLIFNEGYSAQRRSAECASRCARRRSGWRGCLLRLFQSEPENHGARGAAAVAACRATAARFARTARSFAGRPKTGSLWNGTMIERGWR